MPTVIKKGETRIIDLTFKAHAGFTKLKVNLRAEHPSGLSTSLKPSSIELAAGQEAKVQLEVKASTDSGNITIRGLSVSIGVAVYPRGGTTLEQLMLSADTALYTAKANGRNQVVSLE